MVGNLLSVAKVSNEDTICFTTTATACEGTVTGVTGTDPIASSGGAAPVISLNDSGVTYAKIQNVSATNRILGRESANAGVIEEITPTNLRTMLNVADGATACEGTVTGVTGTAPIASSGGAAPVISLNDSGVTYAKIQNVSATNRILGRESANAGVIEEITPTNLRTMLNVANGATANDTNANLLCRANHTGEQAASTISDFDTEVANNTAVAANTAKVSAFSTNGSQAGYVCPTGTCTNYCAAVSSANAFVGCNTNNCVDVTTVKASSSVDVSSGTLSASCIDVGTQTATGNIAALSLSTAGSGNCITSSLFCKSSSTGEMALTQDQLYFLEIGGTPGFLGGDAKACFRVRNSANSADVGFAKLITDSTGVFSISVNSSATTCCRLSITTAGSVTIPGSITSTTCVDACCLKGSYNAGGLTGTVNLNNLPASAKCQGTVTPSSLDTFTNKSGNISQWNNDSNYTTNTGTVTSVCGGTGLSGTITGSGCLDLDIATASALGGIKVSTGLTINSTTGALSVTVPTANDFTDACASKLNGIADGATANAGTVTSVSAGTGLTAGGTAADPSLSLNAATGSALGGIIVGTGLSVTSGTVSVTVPTANDFTNACSNKLSGLTTGFSAAGTDSNFVCPRGSVENYCALIICSVGTNNCIKGSVVCATSALHGEGSNITDLDASEIKSGTVATTYLPAAALCTGTVNNVGSTADDILGISSASICAHDAGSDKIVFWDDSVSALKYLTVGSNLSISGTTISASASGGGATTSASGFTKPTTTTDSFCVAAGELICAPTFRGSTYCGSTFISSTALDVKYSTECMASLCYDTSGGGFLRLKTSHCGYDTGCTQHSSNNDQGIIFYANGCLAASCACNGNISSSYVSCGLSVSDHRLKENTNCWSNICCSTNIIKQVPVYSFNWSARGRERLLQAPINNKKIGFLAHEVQEALHDIDDIVKGEKDGTNEDGSILAQEIYDSNLIPILWSALQETIKKVEDLEERVKTLESS